MTRLVSRNSQARPSSIHLALRQERSFREWMCCLQPCRTACRRALTLLFSLESQLELVFCASLLFLLRTVLDSCDIVCYPLQVTILRILQSSNMFHCNCSISSLLGCMSYGHVKTFGESFLGQCCRQVKIRAVFWSSKSIAGGLKKGNNANNQ